MTLLTWILIGLMIGLVANRLINHAAGNSLLNMILGVAGAVPGGLILNHLEVEGTNGHNAYSLSLAVSGAVLMIFVCNVLIFGGGLGKPIKHDETGYR